MRVVEEAVWGPGRQGEAVRGPGSRGEQTTSEALEDFANSTTFHGAVNIFDSKSIWVRRLFWALLFLAAVGYCFKGFYDTVRDTVTTTPS